MTKIDSNVAQQVADVARPVQTAQVRSQQTQQATAQQISDASAGSVSADETRAAAAQLKQVVENASGQRLNLQVKNKAEVPYVVVSDQVTGEVIQQIPSEIVLRMQRAINPDKTSGLLVDDLA